MEILDNIYILAVKNKQLIPTGLLLALGMIVGKKLKKSDELSNEYLGDNIPLDLIARLKDA